MNEPNAIHAPPKLKPTLASRALVAVGVIVFLAAAAALAEHASHEAFQARVASFNNEVLHVALPTVEIVGQREPTAMGAAGNAISHDNARCANSANPTDPNRAKLS